MDDCESLRIIQQRRSQEFHLAVALRVGRLTRGGVLGYEPIDECLDGVLGGMVYRDLGEVFGGILCDPLGGHP